MPNLMLPDSAMPGFTMHRASVFTRAIGVLMLLPLIALVAACGADSSTAATSDTAAATSSTTPAGVRAVPVDAALAIFNNQPDDLVILDVRTSEEFAAGHLDGAILIDFYEPDFNAQVAELDRDVPYLMYCRSGNRSGTAADVMADLGFADVADIDGGINSWVAAGHPTVT